MKFKVENGKVITVSEEGDVKGYSYWATGERYKSALSYKYNFDIEQYSRYYYYDKEIDKILIRYYNCKSIDLSESGFRLMYNLERLCIHKTPNFKEFVCDTIGYVENLYELKKYKTYYKLIVWGESSWGRSYFSIHDDCRCHVLEDKHDPDIGKITRLIKL